MGKFPRSCPQNAHRTPTPRLQQLRGLLVLDFVVDPLANPFHQFEIGELQHLGHGVLRAPSRLGVVLDQRHDLARGHGETIIDFDIDGHSQDSGLEAIVALLLPSLFLGNFLPPFHIRLLVVAEIDTDRGPLDHVDVLGTLDDGGKELQGRGTCDRMDEGENGK